MRRILSLFLLAAALAGCERRDSARAPADSAALPSGDWTLEPGTRAGALRRGGAKNDLVKAYGAENVRDTLVVLGEGETARGTILYPDDPQRRLQVVWGDAAAKREPKRIILRGERSRWSLPRGISLGSSLEELETKNGRPFRLTGFAWDYAGAVTSWGGGALDSLLGSRTKVHLAPRIEDRAGPDYARTQGDREFHSSDPSMRALRPRIYQIYVDLGGD